MTAAPPGATALPGDRNPPPEALPRRPWLLSDYRRNLVVVWVVSATMIVGFVAVLLTIAYFSPRVAQREYRSDARFGVSCPAACRVLSHQPGI